ncbi:50S ribosomal protein L11 methyltransferase [Streptomyces albipurpureus]|uniref:50S ribosomal protein L11 methyltransferase n=1 Tax=Streptomyces albipurpureus TaxID=2897419 RepID=A0ABT0UM90_9ACTN|nr:50S ribosomal protein L11 methyltransferase [Streptomyces sp. CWNU-1]MCM2388376.1 50S ribosomal protein L11 methyltransferase [Streptomyces sp. CWNU-1]
MRLVVSALQAQVREANQLLGETYEILSHPQGIFDPKVQSAVLAKMARNTVPRWHFAMLNDVERNSALNAALHAQIPAGSVVLDIGTGTGLLAMGAVKAGASHVYTCEENPLLAEIARQIVAEHGMSDSITVLNKRSTQLVVGRDLTRKVDVLVSEIVDCGLIGEGLLPSVRHAREHLLASDGVMMPVAARLYGRLVNGAALMNLNRAGQANGFDVSLINSAATQGHFPLRLQTWPHLMLSEAVELAAFDLRSGPLEPGGRTLAILATADGEAQALATWFELDLGGDITLSNSPENTSSHWMQALIPLEKPAPVVAGGTCSVELRWSDYSLTAS